MSDNYQGAMYLTVRNDEYVSPTARQRLKPVKVTIGYPTVVNANEVVIRLNVVIPRRAFNALIPTMDVIIDDTQLHMPVEIEAVRA